jgi:hypothetical protein
MKTKLLLTFVFAVNLLFSQNNKEFDDLPSGIYFKDGNQVTALDPTIVNFSQKGNSFLHQLGVKIKVIAELIGLEANYQIKNDTKFYFKFKPEEKELNSSNSNATNKVGEENYMNILMSGSNSKAISPNEFKLVRFKIEKGKRTYLAGKYDDFLGISKIYSIDPNAVVDFKYKKISDNLYEVNFPKELIFGEYAFIYLNSKSNYDFLNANNLTKVFDFSVK